MEEEEKTDPEIDLRAFTLPNLGPLLPLMKDSTITEIMVNDVRNVMVEKEGKMMFSGLKIPAVEELNRIMRAILESSGREIDIDHPYADVMLPDGSRVNLITVPLTQHGPCITIRKFPERRFTLEDLVQGEMLDPRMGQFLRACVMGKMNILISGGTGSGKTTLLSALVHQIPKAERIVTIEDTPELRISHTNSVQLQTKPELPGHPPILARELVANSLRMRPDRIVVGECRRAEAFDMLQAMNTGHGGSMTTIHANSTRDALFRLETLVMMAGIEIPLVAVRRQMNSALDLVVQIKRFRSGQRRVTQISELTGLEGETITLQDIYLYESEAERFKCTGFVPTFLDRLSDNGVEIPRDFFA